MFFRGVFGGGVLFHFWLFLLCFLFWLFCRAVSGCCFGLFFAVSGLFGMVFAVVFIRCLFLLAVVFLPSIFGVVVVVRFIFCFFS